MKENTKKELFSWAKTIGFTLVLIASIRGVLFTPSSVQGESMMPTLENNERVLVNKIGDSISGLER
ncbi:S26 family signal peptidase, partial [Bacillus thuringiensis]|uniref:S26 family signal peptidase n=1 Tax=Bacillus thuringiensis TaxID=1428 RepID=UPI002DB79DB2